MWQHNFSTKYTSICDDDCHYNLVPGYLSSYSHSCFSSYSLYSFGRTASVSFMSTHILFSGPLYVCCILSGLFLPQYLQVCSLTLFNSLFKYQSVRPFLIILPKVASSPSLFVALYCICFHSPCHYCHYNIIYCLSP